MYNQKEEERYFLSFEIWLWERILIWVKWTDMRNEKALARLGEERKLMGIAYTLRNCLQERIIEQKGRRETRRLECLKTLKMEEVISR